MLKAGRAVRHRLQGRGGCGIWPDMEDDRGFSLPLPGSVLAKTADAEMGLETQRLVEGLKESN